MLRNNWNLSAPVPSRPTDVKWSPRIKRAEVKTWTCTQMACNGLYKSWMIWLLRDMRSVREEGGSVGRNVWLPQIVHDCHLQPFFLGYKNQKGASISVRPFQQYEVMPMSRDFQSSGEPLVSWEKFCAIIVPRITLHLYPKLSTYFSFCKSGSLDPFS
jgi:hypothetical protein